MPNTTLQATKIFVVDPCPGDYRRLAAQAPLAGYQFHYATTGDETLRLSCQIAPHLWLIHFQLPDIRGLELLALLRERVTGARCVLVGDSYSATDELAARQAGATLYACKPLEQDWLQSLPIRSDGRQASGAPDSLRCSQPLPWTVPPSRASPMLNTPEPAPSLSDRD
jgi:DNA-binding response OmpR family regulator